jgi:hypothetical protein
VDDPTRYLLTLEQMIENDYPIPSYMADVFEKPPDWVETPEPNAATGSKAGHPKVYAIDCEMVFDFSISQDGFIQLETDVLYKVCHGKWQGVDAGLCYRL